MLGNGGVGWKAIEIARRGIGVAVRGPFACSATRARKRVSCSCMSGTFGRRGNGSKTFRSGLERIRQEVEAIGRTLDVRRTQFRLTPPQFHSSHQTGASE